MRLKRSPETGNEEGQAITEYVLMVSAVLSLYLIAVGFINRSGLANKLAAPITQDFARAYRYGNTKTLGFEDGGPKNHPRIFSQDNGRIFINPSGP